jgi:transcriptional regulator with XRE-family HTH domain
MKVRTITPPFDYREIRAILARNRISSKRLALASGLSPEHLSRILNGYAPGELAIYKLKQGLLVLGIDSAILFISDQGKENAHPRAK